MRRDNRQNRLAKAPLGQRKVQSTKRKIISKIHLGIIPRGIKKVFKFIYQKTFFFHFCICRVENEKEYDLFYIYESQGINHLVLGQFNYL